MERITKKKVNSNNDYALNFKENFPKTLYQAVQKLGQLEDIFELIEEMYKKPVCWKDNYGEVFYDYYTHSTILYNPKINEIEIYEYEFIARYKVEEYGITWWLKDRSE